MTKITQEMWDEALQKIQTLICDYVEEKVKFVYVDVSLAQRAEKAAKLRLWYKSGYRTKELYTAMTEL